MDTTRNCRLWLKGVDKHGNGEQQNQEGRITGLAGSALENIMKGGSKKR